MRGRSRSHILPLHTSVSSSKRHVFSNLCFPLVLTYRALSCWHEIICNSFSNPARQPANITLKRCRYLKHLAYPVLSPCGRMWYMLEGGARRLRISKGHYWAFETTVFLQYHREIRRWDKKCFRSLCAQNDQEDICGLISITMAAGTLVKW